MKIINDNILISEYSIFEEYLKRDGKGILINTVNCEGFMGKGLALEFKIRFGDNYFLDYEKKCKNKEIEVGKIDYYKENNLKIINFPTKNLYKLESKIIWIKDGLNDLCLKIENRLFDNDIIYIPKLGSSQGGLKWEDVFFLIKEKLLNIKNNKVKFIICGDSESGEIEKNILEKIKDYNGEKISEKTLKNIKENLYKIKRLRDLLNLKGVGENTYSEILKIGNTKELKLF